MSKQYNKYFLFLILKKNRLNKVFTKANSFLKDKESFLIKRDNIIILKKDSASKLRATTNLLLRHLKIHETFIEWMKK